MGKIKAVNDFLAVKPEDVSLKDVFDEDSVEGIGVGSVFIENEKHPSYKKGLKVYYNPSSVLNIKIKDEELDVINVNNIMLCQ